MQNINVNIVPDSYPQTIRYSQGDVGREFKINVVGFTIPTGATVKIQATKPSGFGFSVAGTPGANNSVSFTTTAIMTDEAGRFPAELEITKDSVVIGTANFIMWGEANPHPEGTTDGQQGTIIPELTLLVERVEAAADKILDMEVVANTLPAGSQATYSYDEDLNKATFGIPQGEAGAGAAGVVADAYSSSKTYKVGDYALHNSNLYRCTTAITTAEAFTAAHWTQIVLANDVSDLKTDFNNKISLYGDSTTLIDCLKTNDPDYLTGKAYEDNHGNIISVSGCNITGYIYLSAGEKIIVNYELPNTAYAIKVAKYNTNKQWISTTIQIEQTTGSKTYEYTTDSNCFVRVQIWDVNLHASIYVQNFYKIRKEALDLDSVLPTSNFNMYLSDEYVNLIDRSDSDFLKGKAYSGSTNNIIDFSSSNISNYIFLPQGEELHINYELPNVVYQIKYAVYNYSKQWVKTVPLTTSVPTGHQEVTYTAEYDCYVRIQFYTDNETILATGNAVKKFRGETIPQTVIPLTNKIWTSFGDSIVYQNKWQPLIANALGLSHQNCGIGSTPLSGSNANAFWQTVRLDAIKATNADIVTILGGANDMVLNPVIGSESNLLDKDTSTFIGAYSYIINDLLTWKPSLKIIIMSTTYAHNNGADVRPSGSLLTYGDFANACKLVAEYYHLPFVDLYNESGFNQYTMNNSPYNIYSSDHIHPNDTGAKIIASMVMEKFKEVLNFI